MFKRKQKILTPQQAEEIRIQEFFRPYCAKHSAVFLRIILFAVTVTNACGQFGNGRLLRRNRRFWRTLRTGIL